MLGKHSTNWVTSPTRLYSSANGNWFWLHPSWYFMLHTCHLKPQIFWIILYSLALLFLSWVWPFSSSDPVVFQEPALQMHFLSPPPFSPDIQLILHRVSSEHPETNLTVVFPPSHIPEPLLAWRRKPKCPWLVLVGAFIPLPNFRVLSFTSFDPSVFPIHLFFQPLIQHQIPVLCWKNICLSVKNGLSLINLSLTKSCCPLNHWPFHHVTFPSHHCMVPNRTLSLAHQP